MLRTMLCCSKRDLLGVLYIILLSGTLSCSMQFHPAQHYAVYHFDSFLVYGPWSTWTPCSIFCGIGVKQRNRSCIPPGSNCGNYTFEQRPCGEANCQRVIGEIFS